MTTPSTATVEITTTPTKATKPKRLPWYRLSTWIPDPRWAHPIEAALWLYVAGLIVGAPWWAIPGWVALPAVPIFAVLGVARAKRAWSEETYGAELRSTMTYLGATAGAAAGAWLTFAVWTNPLTAFGWLALATVWFGTWYGVVRTTAPKAAAAIVAARAEAQITAVTQTWNEILAASGLKLKVAQVRETRAGYAIGVEPVDDKAPVSYADLSGKRTDITTRASALLARAGISLRATGIQFEETTVAHVHLIHVCTKDVLSQTVPYEPHPEPSTIKDPIDFALYEDGKPLQITLGGPQGGTNGKIVGATGSGKTVCVNCIIGRVGENVDAINVVVATNKLVPLVYPWIKPWLEGKAARPGIDWIAGQNPDRVLEVLAAVYRIVCDRNARLSNEDTHEPTADAPAIVVWIEEAGKIAVRKNTVVTHDGQKVGFSQLLNLIDAEDRSAQVSVMTLNQNDLYQALGDFGSEIARNTPFRICLKTLAPQDGPAVLPGLNAAYSDTAKLRHNSMLVQPSIEDPRVMPAKSYLLRGDDIHPVAIRNAAWRPDLEPELVTAVGEVWSDRWSPDRLPELVAAARKDGLEWPVHNNTPEDDLDVELRNLLAQHATEQPAIESGGTGGVEFPDAGENLAKLNAAAEIPALTLPEPLASVMTILRDADAPKEWVSTQQLAIILGRVTADAAAEERKVAAQKLGREMSTIHEDLRAVPRDRMQGYEVATLKTVAARIARGEA